MQIRGLPFPAIAVAAAFLLSACASTPWSSAEKQAPEIRVYDSAQLRHGQYELVRRLWVDSWRTAFWVPRHTSEAAGIAALQVEAARLGANGLINVHCLNQGHSIWSWSKEPAIICQGNAIRVP